MSLFPAYAIKHEEEDESLHIVEPTTHLKTEQISQHAVPETEVWDIPTLSATRPSNEPKTEDWDIESLRPSNVVEKVQEVAKKKKKKKKEVHKVKKKKKQSERDYDETISISDTRKQYSPQHYNLTDVDSSSFFVDSKGDCLLYNTATLKFPKRPKYEKQSHNGLGTGSVRRHRRPKRYYRMPPPDTGMTPPPERAAALRRAIADSPLDEELWERYLDYLERFADATEVTEAAASAASLAGNTSSLRRRAHQALWRVLQAKEYAQWLQKALIEEKRLEAKSELWIRLATAAAWPGGGGGPDGGDGALRHVAAAALADCRAAPPPAVYPALLYIYGSSLRSGGRWERLTQLVELVVAMNAPASVAAVFPPKLSAEAEARLRRAEAELADYELKAVRSGLPRGEVWARVERARAALHWRAAAAAQEAACDPERAPPPSDLADLLMPLPGGQSQETILRVIITLLRLVEVPLLPASSYLERVIDGGRGVAREAVARWEGASGAMLVALFRAARRLPPSNVVRASDPAVRGALLAKTPLRRLTTPDNDPTGFECWRGALWEGALRWAGGRARTALLAWRLRDIHARMLVSPLAERATWRRIARGLAKQFGPPSPSEGVTSVALLARIEAAAGDVARGVKVATLGLTAALQRGEVTPDVLFAARVVNELDGVAGQWAIVCAVEGRPPPHPLPNSPPSQSDLHAALARCEERCTELEQRFEIQEQEMSAEDEIGNGEDAIIDAMLPGDAEWAAARAALAPPHRVAGLVTELEKALSRRYKTPDVLRYWEQSACALVTASRAAGPGPRTTTAADTAARHFAHNGYLLLANAATPLWRGVSEARPRGASEAAALAALAGALPAVLAAEAGADPGAAEKAARVCGRYGCAGCGGSTLSLLRVHCAARARSAHTAHALTAALDYHPHAKELYVSGASLWPGMAEALPDLALDRGLRLHALPEELAPLPDVPTSTGDKGDMRDNDGERSEMVTVTDN